MPALGDSPARIIQQAIVALALGSDPDTARPVTGDWPVYVEKMPPKELDQAIAVVNVQGTADGRLQFTGEALSHPGVHVTVRARTGEVAYVKASAIRAGLAEDATGMVVLYGGNGYLLNAVTQFSDVYRVTEPGGERARYTFNATVSLKSSPFPAAAALYRFDGDYLDASGNGRTAEDFSLTFTTGKFGQGITSAVGGEADVDPPVLTAAADEAWAISGWFKGQSSVRIYDDNGDYNSVGIEPSGITISGISGGAITLTGPVVGAGFHHLVLTGDSGTIRLYVDGTLADSVIVPLPGAILNGYINVFPEVVGSVVDDLAFVDDTLTAQQVSYLWNNGTGRVYPVD